MNQVDKNSGYIRIPRDIIYQPIFQNKEALCLWQYILLSAADTKTTDTIENNTIVINPGQILLCPIGLVEEIWQREEEIINGLKFIADCQLIMTREIGDHVLVTIINWDDYTGAPREPIGGSDE